MNVAIVGAGRQGWRRALALGSDANARLVLVSDPDRHAAERLATEFSCRAFHDWERAVDDREIDIMVVCTPPHLHAPISVAALTVGKHVLCEKPMGRDAREAMQIISAARSSGARLKAGYNHRHHASVRQGKAWIDQGCIGEVMFVRGRYGIGGRPGYEAEWRANPEVSGGGQLLDQGMHLLDLSRWFAGEFSEAFGFLGTMFWEMAPAEDNAFALLRTPRGQVASLHASWTQWKNLFSLEIFGTNGYVQLEGLQGSYGTERAVLGKRAFLEPFREEVIEFRGEDISFSAEWQEFVASIKEDREPLGNGADAVEALKLATAIYASARRGCVVRLSEAESGV